MQSPNFGPKSKRKEPARLHRVALPPRISCWMAAAGGAAEPPRIQAIDALSVHRICSGQARRRARVAKLSALDSCGMPLQVVLDLAGAVKELVENALDAGATVVEARSRASCAPAKVLTPHTVGATQGAWLGAGGGCGQRVRRVA